MICHYYRYHWYFYIETLFSIDTNLNKWNCNSVFESSSYRPDQNTSSHYRNSSVPHNDADRDYKSYLFEEKFRRFHSGCFLRIIIFDQEIRASFLWVIKLITLNSSWKKLAYTYNAQYREENPGSPLEPSCNLALVQRSSQNFQKNTNLGLVTPSDI